MRALLCLLLILPTAGSLTVIGNTTVTLADFNITDFSINPLTVYQNARISYRLEVENTGAVNITNMTLEVQILCAAFSDSTIVSLDVGASALFSGYWLAAQSPGACAARAIAAVAGLNKTKDVHFQIASLPPISTGPQISISPSSITPVSSKETKISVPRFDILTELIPAAGGRVLVVIKNHGSDVSDVQAAITGVDPNWIWLEETSFSITSGAEKDLWMEINFPSTAQFQDYLGGVELSKVGEKIGTQYFIVRPLHQPASPGVQVLRKVSINVDEKKAIVGLRTQNTGEEVDVTIAENIPKKIASTTAQIKFDPEPQIISADPLVRWDLRNFPKNETLWIKYNISNASLNYSDYMDWASAGITVLEKPTPPSPAAQEPIEQEEVVPEQEVEISPLIIYFTIAALALIALIYFFRKRR